MPQPFEVRIDQRRIDAPGATYPRSQEWWQRFVPIWVDVAIEADDIVVLRTNDKSINGAAEIVTIPVTPAQRRRLDQSLERWIGNGPLAAAVIETGA